MLVCLGVTATTACSQVKPVQKESGKSIDERNADFEIVLGPNWKRRFAELAFEWEDTDSMQEIVISALQSKETMESRSRMDTALRIMDIRKKAVSEIAEGKATFGKVERTENESTAEVVLRGVDPVYGMQIYISVIARPTRVVTLSYYKYKPLLSDEEFRAKSQDVRSLLKVN